MGGRGNYTTSGDASPIGANDLWIAAQALVVEAVLVTDNLREFQRVKGLKLENWLLKMTGSAPSSQ